jgi:flagellar basal body-associated protein FliL
MRAILLILILAIVALIAAIATGFLDISQTREAKTPQISATTKGITASGGQSPAFQVETGSVQVQTGATNVTTPTVKIEGRQTQVQTPKLTVNRPGARPQPTTNAQ